MRQEARQAHIDGTLSRIIHQDARSGFAVAFLMQDDGRTSKIVHTGALPRLGTRVRCEGAWEQGPYGQQFRTTDLAANAEADNDFLAEYIARNGLPGIGPARARRLVQAFGRYSARALARDPDGVSRATGLRMDQALAVQQTWNEHIEEHRSNLQLQHAGLAPHQADAAVQHYGEEANKILRRDPYRLAREVKGIGFQSADRCARRIGIELDDPQRLQAGIRETLERANGNGHSALDAERVATEAQKLLDQPDYAVAMEIRAMVDDGALLEVNAGGRVCLQNERYAKVEAEVAELIRAHAAREAPADTRIGALASNTGLDASQVRALETLDAHALGLLVGGPGTGKSTLIDTLLANIETPRDQVLLCAPTGRAAHRMQETTGYEASTLHRALEFNPGRHRFGRTSKNPLDARLVIVDEASMLDLSLARHLLRALRPDTRLLLVGDPDQLPSVLPGEVLADLVDSERVATARLDTVHRTGRESTIPLVAQGLLGAGQIRAGEDLSADVCWIDIEKDDEVGDRIIELFAHRLPAMDHGADPRHTTQVLSPVHRTDAGTRELNERIQSALHPGVDPDHLGRPLAGDRIMHLVNAPDDGLSNGDIGVVEHVGKKGALHARFGDIEVELRGKSRNRVTLAFATTTHKAQGSEIDNVIIPLVQSHSYMLDRRLLYTAITRARSRVVFVGRRRLMSHRIAQTTRGRRTTTLTQRLHDGAKTDGDASEAQE